MKPINECSREERLERALMAIEALTYQFGEGTLDDFKDATPEQISQFCSDVYMISHTAPGRCGNPHESWLKKIEEIEAFGKSAKIYDAEKQLAKTAEKSSLREVLGMV
jgi:hypothetical protein